MKKPSAVLPSWETFVAFVFADDLSMILRCHLSLEVALNKVIEVRAQPHPTSELDRLPFMAKVDLCIAIGALSRRSRQAWAVANKLRNAFAHDLSASLTDSQADELERALGWPWTANEEVERLEASIPGWPTDAAEEVRQLIRSAPGASPRTRTLLFLSLLYGEAVHAARMDTAAFGTPRNQWTVVGDKVRVTPITKGK